MSTFELYAKNQLVIELVSQIITHMRSLHSGMKPADIESAVRSVAKNFGDFDFRTNNALGVTFNAVMSAFNDLYPADADRGEDSSEGFADIYKKCRAEAMVANTELYSMSIQMAADVSLTVGVLSDSIPRATASVLSRVKEGVSSDTATIDLARFIAAEIKPWAMFGIQDPLLREAFTARAVAYAQQVANVLQPGAEIYPYYAGNTLARIPTSFPAFDGDEKALVDEVRALLQQLPGAGDLAPETHDWIAEALGNSYRYISVVSGAVLALNEASYGRICALSEEFSAAALVIHNLNGAGMKGTEISTVIQQRMQQFMEAIYLLHAASIILVGTLEPKNALILGTYPEIPEWDSNSGERPSPNGLDRIKTIYVHPINYRRFAAEKGPDEWIRVTAHYRFIQQWPIGRYCVPEDEVMSNNRDEAYQRASIIRRVEELNQRSEIEMRELIRSTMRTALDQWFRAEWFVQKGESEQILSQHEMLAEQAASRAGLPGISNQRIINDYLVGIWNNPAVSDIYSNIRAAIGRQLDNDAMLAGTNGGNEVCIASGPSYVGTMMEAVVSHVLGFLKKRIVATATA